MTSLRTIASAIKTRLEEITALAGNVHHYRRSDIDSRVDAAMSKVKGRAVIIRVLTAKNTLVARQSSFYVGRLTVTLFTAPALTAKDAVDADDLMTAIEAKLHGWWPDGVPSNTVMKLHCEGVSYGDEPAFDVATLSLTTGNLK